MGCGSKKKSETSLELLNVSYDPTREFYEEFNKAFADDYYKKHNKRVSIKQSHGGSGKQARSVIDGLEADVVTLALAFDIDAIASKTQLLPKTWQSRLPEHSAPYTSTIVFLVRKGNPKNIKDWGDVIREDVSIVTPNPKTSGAARWAYLAAWGYAQRLAGGSKQTARAYIEKFYKRVAVLDSGARGATTSFVQNKVGDVLVSWENEAHLVIKESGAEEFVIVTPSTSILAEPTVAWIDTVTKKHGTKDLAEAYLRHLYSPQGQAIAVKHHFRPRTAELGKAFPALKLFTLEEVFGNWDKAQREHFADGSTFDQVMERRK